MKSGLSRAPTTSPSARRTCTGRAAGPTRCGVTREPTSTVTMGKTHLMHSIAHLVKQRDPEARRCARALGALRVRHVHTTR